MSSPPHKRLRLATPPSQFMDQRPRSVHDEAFMKRLANMSIALVDLAIFEELVTLDAADTDKDGDGCFSRRVTGTFLEQVKEVLVQMHHVLYDQGDPAIDIPDPRPLSEQSLLSMISVPKPSAPVFNPPQQHAMPSPTTQRSAKSDGPPTQRVTSCMTLSPLCIRHKRCCELAQFIKGSATSLGVHVLWSTFLKMEAISGGMTIYDVRQQTTGPDHASIKMAPQPSGSKWMRASPSAWPPHLWQSSSSPPHGIEGADDFADPRRPPIGNITGLCQSVCPRTARQSCRLAPDSIPLVTEDTITSVPFLQELQGDVGFCCDFAHDTDSPNRSDNDVERITAALRVLLHTAYHQYLAVALAISELYGWTNDKPSPLASRQSHIIPNLVFYQPYSQSDPPRHQRSGDIPLSPCV
ncbi:hypothetical protein RI367_001454 [Sorochytrium milnesiophthora]